MWLIILGVLLILLAFVIYKFFMNNNPLNITHTQTNDGYDISWNGGKDSYRLKYGFEPGQYTFNNVIHTNKYHIKADKCWDVYIDVDGSEYMIKGKKLDKPINIKVE